MIQRAREKRVLLVFVVAALMMFTGAVMAKRLPFQSDSYEDLKIFTEVLSYVEANYVDEVEAEKLVQGAIRGMLRTLDAHSSYMPRDMYREMQVETEGQFGGLGIEITIRDEILTVVSPIEGTPAFRAGIQAGDKIVTVEGTTTKDMSLIEAVKLLRGPVDTSVTIGVMREGFKEPKDFTLTRAVIQIKSVRSKMLPDSIGYIKLRSFHKNTSEELDEALLDFDERHISALVLDLRNNPGGLLEQAIAVTDEFIEGGQLIVYTKGRLANQNMKGYSKTESAHHPNVPLVILVNGGSASASEIVAGALQDHKRATIIGTKTFGKGSVQTIIPLSDGSGLRLTTAKYYTPKGRMIHDKGIIPDIVVEEPKPETAEGDESASAPSRSSDLPNDDLSGDPQLQKAVETLKEEVKQHKKKAAKAG
jgi:carboxyl-terminal processing protease